MEEIQDPGKTPMAICDEAPGRLEIDIESGRPIANCAYSKLIQLGYTCHSLASEDEKDGHSTNYLYHLAYPGTDDNGRRKNAPRMSKTD